MIFERTEPVVLAGITIGTLCAFAVPTAIAVVVLGLVGIIIQIMVFTISFRRMQSSFSSGKMGRMPKRLSSETDLTSVDSLGSASELDATDHIRSRGVPTCVTVGETEQGLSLDGKDPQQQVSHEYEPSFLPRELLGPLPARPDRGNSGRSRPTREPFHIQEVRNHQPTEFNHELEESQPSVNRRPPIEKRLEQERLRLSLSRSDESVPVKATATSLRFKDVNGCEIRYTLRPSKKASRAVFLEVVAEGKKPRKVKAIVYDDSVMSICDSKDEFLVPSNVIEAVMKSLILLCKIAGVKLDCINGSPALKRVLSSFDVNKPLTKVLSSNSLAEQELAARLSQGCPKSSPTTLRAMQSI